MVMAKMRIMMTSKLKDRNFIIVVYCLTVYVMAFLLKIHFCELLSDRVKHIF